ncbi:MAG: S9 family peptidase, partial [Lutimonas sp.]
MKKTTLLFLALFGLSQMMIAQEDKYQWLEEVDGEKALAFVEAQNKATIEKLSAEKDYQDIYDKSLAIYNSKERIPNPTIRGEYVYNFWKDQDHERGIWRRCLLSSYIDGKLDWETLLDIDELAKKEDIKWVYKGTSGLYPSYDRFLVELSKGGGDAVVIKEFDVKTKQFIEDGFYMDEAKGSASYVDENTLIVSTDFGEGTTTTSGYPNQVKLWKRGTPLKDAQLIYEGQTSDVGTWGGVMRDGTKAYTMITRAPSFFTSQNLIWMDEKAVKVDIPEDASPKGILNDQLIVQLKSDWTVNNKTYKTGTLLSLNFTALLKGNKDIKVILEPDEFSSISEVSTTKNKLLINLLTNVTGQLFIYTYNNGQWTSEKVEAPQLGTISIVGTTELSDNYFFDFENFITPSTLYFADASKNTFKPYQSLPAFFDASKYEVKQFKARSKDGTMIPYFIVAAKNMKNDGSNPTLVYAYGGFEVSLSPFYASTFGVSWLDKGGTFVLANIRGGGEYGP